MALIALTGSGIQRLLYPVKGPFLLRNTGNQRGRAGGMRSEAGFKSMLRSLLHNPDGRLTTYKDRHRIASLLSLVPMSMPQIMLLFGTDKQRQGQHSYGKTYQRLFRDARYQRLKILEIGVLSGRSRYWRGGPISLVPLRWDWISRTSIR